MKKITKKYGRKSLALLLSLVMLFSLFQLTALATEGEDAPVLVSAKQIKAKGDASTNNDGVSISKTIAGTELENVFDITLTVETQHKIEEIWSTAKDTAVVIVMDISQTMNSKIGGNNGDQSRYEAAIAAAESFIEDYAAYDSDAKRDLGFVSFNTDAHETFALQSCETEDEAEALIKTMKNKTGAIIDAENYKDSYSRFTNIEGGLKRAQDMLAASAAENQYIIFISDGFPTTYLENGYKGYEPYDSTGSIFRNRRTACTHKCHY